jgi:hypothetical protein
LIDAAKLPHFRHVKRGYLQGASAPVQGKETMPAAVDPITEVFNALPGVGIEQADLGELVDPRLPPLLVVVILLKELDQLVPRGCEGPSRRWRDRQGDHA